LVTESVLDFVETVVFELVAESVLVLETEAELLTVPVFNIVCVIIPVGVIVFDVLLVLDTEELPE